MTIICLHDKALIATFLRRNAALYTYALGDLDDFYWPYTTWYALEREGTIREICLMYSGTTPPTFLGLSGEPDGEIHGFLRRLAPLLPRRFDAHLSGNLVDVLRDEYTVDSYGTHYKMALRKPECLAMIDTSEVVELREGDLPALRCLYDVAYPGNWFYPRMLRTGLYRGIWRGDRLVSVAGIHTYSPEYRVAALGNITTLPDFRGQGLAAAVTAALCQSLIQRDTLVGLNVKADNLRAIATYARLGFAITDTYEECGLNARGVADYIRATSDD